jgi:hypothetical protein
VAEECKKSGASLTELRSGSRRGRLPVVRTKIVRGLVENYGVGVAEVARQVGISTSGVSKILTRTLSNSQHRPASGSSPHIFAPVELTVLTDMTSDIRHWRDVAQPRV